MAIQQRLPRSLRLHLARLLTVLLFATELAIAWYEGGDGDLWDLLTGTGFSLEPPTPDPTATATLTATAPPTYMPTGTPTATFTETPASTPSPIPVSTSTPMPTSTSTITATATITYSPTFTATPVVEVTETPQITPGSPTPTPTGTVLEFLDEAGTPFANYLVHILGIGSFLTDDAGRIVIDGRRRGVRILFSEQAFALPSLSNNQKIVAERRENVEACYNEQRMKAHLAMDTAWYELVEYSIGTLKKLNNTAHERRAIAEVNIRTQRLSAGLVSLCFSQRVPFQALRRQSLRVYRYFFRAIRNRGSRTILRERRADARSRRRGYLLQRDFLTELENFAATVRTSQ